MPKALPPAPINELPPETPVAAPDAEATGSSFAPAIDADTSPPTASASTSAPPPGLDEFIAPEVAQEKYGGLGQQSIGFLEGAAKGATFGTSTGIETGLGLAKPEAIRGREEAGPGPMLGEIAGVAGSTLIPGYGEGNILRAGGEGAAALAGLGKTGTLIDQIGAHAVQAAFEGAAFQAGDEVSKVFSQDPDQTAQTAVAHMGLAAVMAGVGGGLLGAAYGALKRPAMFAEKGAPGIAGSPPPGEIPPVNAISELDRPQVEAGDLKTIVETSPDMSEDAKEGILSGLKKRKPNANQIEKVAGDLGLPVTEVAISAGEDVPRTVDSLLKGPPTFSSNRVKAKYDAAWAGMADKLSDIAGSESGKSAAQAGEEVRQGLVAELDRRYALTQEKYNALKATNETIPVTPGDIDGLKLRLGEVADSFKSPSSPQGRLARLAAREVGNLKTVDDLKTYVSTLWDRLPFNASPGEKRVVAILADEFEAATDSAVERMSKAQRSLVPEAVKVPETVAAGAADDVGGLDKFKNTLKGMSDQLQAGNQLAENTLATLEKEKVAKADYKKFIGIAQELSEQGGKGNIKGYKHARQFLSDELDPEKIVSRLLNKNDSRFNSFFEKNFPKESQVLKDYAKSELRAKFSADGFSPRKYLNAIRGMEPENVEALFGKEGKATLEKLDTYMRESFPKDYNPSGTSHASAWRAFFEHPTVTGIAANSVANLRDARQEAFLKLAAAEPQIKVAQDIGKATSGGFNAATKAAKDVFTSEPAKTAVSKSSALSNRDKIKSLVDKYQARPEDLAKINDNNPVKQYHATFAATASRAVQYLSTIKPNTQPQSPLDRKQKPSAAAESAYNRQVDLAQNPALITQRIKSGTLSPQDILTVKTIYPKYYEMLTQKITDQMVNKLSKKDSSIPYRTQQALSLFMGQPLNSTFSPQSIQSIQSVFAPRQAPDQGQSAQGGGQPKHSTNNLNKLAPSYQTATQAAESRRAKP